MNESLASVSAGLEVPAALSRRAPLNIAVVVHLYYHHLWPEFAAYIRNVPAPFALFVTIPEGSPAAPAILADFPHASVRQVPNVGRDVAPFLALLPELQSFDLVCKVHSKRDTPRHREWRMELLRGLLGSPAQVERIIAGFSERPQMMMAGPRLLFIDGPRHTGDTGKVMTRLGVTTPEQYRFFVGTMFWVRPSLLASFAERYPQSLFVPHEEHDGHPEHAIERLFGASLFADGIEIGLTDGDDPVTILPNNATGALPVEMINFILDRRVVPRHAPTSDQPAPSGASSGAPTMRQLYAAHDGKVSDKWDSYLAHYDRLFAPYRDRNVSILEIGVQNGGSLELTARYFPQAAAIVGCDINPACGELRFTDPRIHVVVGDAGDPATRRSLLIQSRAYDIVIDDGSHRSRDIVRAFANYFPAIRDGGVFIAEDLHCSYWSDHGGGLHHPHSAIAFFQALADVVNHEHWGTGKPARSRLRRFFKAHRTRMSEEDLQHIHAVEFTNSICVVHKRTPEQNTLGRRYLVGRIAAVENAVLPLAGSLPRAPSQAKNPYSLPARPARRKAEPFLVRLARRVDQGLRPLKRAFRRVRRVLRR